jgi:hypothetical protein
MALEGIFIWLVILAFCEISVAASMGSIIGGAGVLILTLCGWLVRLDLDLLAILLGATYGSVLVCLSLMQTNLEAYPGLSARPDRLGRTLSTDITLAAVFMSSAFINSEGGEMLVASLLDVVQGDGDPLEQVIGVFHLFFYKVAALEALLLNIFLLLALLACLSITSLISLGQGSRTSPTLNGMSRVRLVRSFRRQVRRKNSSQIRFNSN